MAPHADSPVDPQDDIDRLPAPSRPSMSARPPRILIIGAGSRGRAYAKAIHNSSNGLLVSVAEPVAYKRQHFGQKYIWGKNSPLPHDGQEFSDWREFLVWEQERRKRVSRGEPDVPEGVDAVFICVLDEMHKEVIVGLKELKLHIMCEKPLATSLQDCLEIYRAQLPGLPSVGTPERIFSIGHVLRYSPHNMLLRKLLLEDRVIGEIMSINHTEPVGWWHFTHSYVRGNWRKESTTAPSLLTKSCHDIDLLLWLLCSPPPNSTKPAHLPTTVSSSGALQYFNKSRKPHAAGEATNCLTCPIEESCKYSAKKIYLAGQVKSFATGNVNWPISIVLPEIEECIAQGGQAAGVSALTAELAADYTTDTPSSEIDSRNWFGRCVWESDNDVCDEQVVTMTWDDDPLPAPTSDREGALRGRGAKSATFHMVAHTRKICERYTHVYGADGEIYADSQDITVEDFASGEKRLYKPHLAGGGHGGGDDGLARQFILAVDRVKNHGVSVEEAQRAYVGCSLEEVVRSHAMVFAAEEARRERKVLDFAEWSAREVEAKLLNRN